MLKFQGNYGIIGFNLSQKLSTAQKLIVNFEPELPLTNDQSLALDCSSTNRLTTIIPLMQ